MPEPTRVEADRIVAEVKTIGEAVSWRMTPGSKTPRWRLEASVVAPITRETLKLIGNYGRTNWGFTLLMDNIPIRRLSFHGAQHRNPDGTIVDQPHKHRWDEIGRDREAYVPTDIDFSDVNQAFFDFLAECNITLVGHYQQLVPL